MDLRDQEWRSDRDNLRCMMSAYDIVSGQRNQARCVGRGDLREPLERLRRGKLGTDHLVVFGQDIDRHEACPLFEGKARWRPRRLPCDYKSGADIGMAGERQLADRGEDAHMRVMRRL